MLTSTTPWDSINIIGDYRVPIDKAMITEGGIINVVWIGDLKRLPPIHPGETLWLHPSAYTIITIVRTSPLQ